MAKKRRKPKHPNRRPDEPRPPVDVIVVAWTVSVTAVVLGDLAAVAAHLYAEYSQPATNTQALAVLLLLTACGMGVVSLMLMGLVLKTGQVRPPQGFLVFAALVAAAPIVAVMIRALATVS